MLPERKGLTRDLFSLRNTVFLLKKCYNYTDSLHGKTEGIFEMLGELRKGFETAYIDGNMVSSESYRPQFLSNNPKEGKKVSSSIEDELLLCDEFMISVAFITMGGITPLLQTLKELEQRNIPGKILTTNYLNFSEPTALKKLNELTNIELKMCDAERSGEGFHTKGYIFKKRRNIQNYHW